MLKVSTLAIAAAFLMMAGVVQAQNQDPSSQDKNFINEAASAGNMEVQLGQYAIATTSNADVKRFAQMMVDDHTKANDQLKNLASNAGVTVPTDLAEMDKHSVDRLEKLNGTEFDKAYSAQMVKDHQKAIEMFNKERDKGTSQPLKDFASNTVPTLQHHLDAAKDLDKKINP